MSIVVSDQDLVERLTAAGSAKLQDAAVLANVSTAELDADFESRQGRTLEEIWKRLGA